MSHRTNPGLGSSQSENQYRSIHFSDSRNRDHVAVRWNHVSGEFLSNVFLVGKLDGGKRPVINLKNLNLFLPYQHFKMECLHLMKDLLQEVDYICKIDFHEAYFAIPINQKYRKYLRFRWEGILCKFLCLWFAIRPAPLNIYKLIEGLYCSVAAPKYSPNNILGQHADNGLVGTGNDHLLWSTSYRI